MPISTGPGLFNFDPSGHRAGGFIRNIVKDTICKTAKAMSPQKLAQFVTATWYSQHGHALPEVTADLQVVMTISNCITDIKVEESDLLITTKTKSVIISFLPIKSYNFRQSKVFGSNGRACLLDG